MAKKNGPAKVEVSRKPGRTRASLPKFDPLLKQLIAHADRAFRSFGHPAALEAYTQALAWEHPKQLSLELRLELLSRLADTHRALGNIAQVADDVGPVDCGPVEIRGMSAPVPVFCVTAQQMAPTDA